MFCLFVYFPNLLLSIYIYIYIYIPVIRFFGLAYQGKDIVFRFIIEYSSLMDFGPLGNNNKSICFYMRILKDDILACVENLRLVIEL
jgi:hypothetical protein